MTRLAHCELDNDASDDEKCSTTHQKNNPPLTFFSSQVRPHSSHRQCPESQRRSSLVVPPPPSPPPERSGRVQLLVSTSSHGLITSHIPAEKGKKTEIIYWYTVTGNPSTQRRARQKQIRKEDDYDSSLVFETSHRASSTEKDHFRSSPISKFSILGTARVAVLVSGKMPGKCWCQNCSAGSRGQK